MHSRNDIAPVTFKSQLIGFDRSEVRAFVENLKNDYDRAMAEAERLRRELRFEKERWFNAVSTGDTAAKEMEKILAAAQRVSEQLVEEARQNATTVVRTAETEAREIVDSAKTRATELERSIDELRTRAEAEAREIVDSAKTRAAELERSIDELRTRWLALKTALASAVDHAERTLAALPDDVVAEAGVSRLNRVDHVART